ARAAPSAALINAVSGMHGTLQTESLVPRPRRAGIGPAPCHHLLAAAEAIRAVVAGAGWNAVLVNRVDPGTLELSRTAGTVAAAANGTARETVSGPGWGAPHMAHVVPEVGGRPRWWSPGGSDAGGKRAPVLHPFGDVSHHVVRAYVGKAFGPR